MKSHTRISSVTIDRKQLALASLILVTLLDGVAVQVYDPVWTDYTHTSIACKVLQQNVVLNIDDLFIW